MLNIVDLARVRGSRGRRKVVGFIFDILLSFPSGGTWWLLLGSGSEVYNWCRGG